MNQLERRYRLTLRVLPAWYRAAWEEDMVATFLASVQTDDPDQAAYAADFGRPPWPEVVSVLVLAVRLRIGGVGSAPRPYAWGEAIRLIAVMGLFWHAVWAAGDQLFSLYLRDQLPFAPPPPDLPFLEPTGIWYALGLPVAAAWIAAFGAVLRGRYRVAAWLAVGAFCGFLAIRLANWARGAPISSPFTATAVYETLFDVALLLALVAFYAGGGPLRLRPWLIAFVACSVALPYALIAIDRLPPERVLVDQAGILTASIAVAAIGWTLRAVVGRRPTPVAWPLALGVLAAGVLVLRLATLASIVPNTAPRDQSEYLTTGLAEAALLVVVGVLLGAVAARGLRRLPQPIAGR